MMDGSAPPTPPLFPLGLEKRSVRVRRDGSSKRTQGRRSLLAVTTLACVSPFWAASVALVLVASRRIDPGDRPQYLKLPPAHTTITITFIFAVIELFAFVGSIVAYGLNRGVVLYRRRLAFFVMGIVTFEAIASGAWVVSRAISYDQSGICSGSLMDEVEECRAGLDLIIAMGAVRFGYAPFVLAATLFYPGPWSKSDALG